MLSCAQWQKQRGRKRESVGVRRTETGGGPRKPGEINTLSAAAERCPCAGDWKEETTTNRSVLDVSLCQHSRTAAPKQAHYFPNYSCTATLTTHNSLFPSTPMHSPTRKRSEANCIHTQHSCCLISRRIKKHSRIHAYPWSIHSKLEHITIRCIPRHPKMCSPFTINSKDDGFFLFFPFCHWMICHPIELPSNLT